jgi:hypothetical protein
LKPVAEQVVAVMGASSGIVEHSTVDGTVGAATVRDSAYTRWALRRPITTAARTLTHPAAALATRLIPKRLTTTLTTSTQRASRPTAAGTPTRTTSASPLPAQ